MLKAGLAVTGGGAVLGGSVLARRGRSGRVDKEGGGDGGPRTPFEVVPFQSDLPLPPVIQQTDFEHNCLEHPDIKKPEVSGQFTRPTKTYRIRIQNVTAEIFPGKETEFFSYNGLVPGPTIKTRLGEPAVVRFINDIEAPISVHHHGGHNPSKFDGYPSDYIFPAGFDPAAVNFPPLAEALADLDLELLEELEGEGCPFQGQFLQKDYCFPNILPVDERHPDGDPSESASTMWYHDHAMDITGENVYRGLAGFYLNFDDLELDMIDSGFLPGDPFEAATPEFDIPLVLQDKVFNADGSLFFDPLDHNGFMGDVMLINGAVQPVFRVQRRKYRFRILNGATARFFEVALSNGQPFLRIGNDSWLLPRAIQQDTILLSNAERADVIIDFRDAPDELFLVDKLVMRDDGRGAKGKRDDRELQEPGTPLVKFIVEGPRMDNRPNEIQVGDQVRPHVPIRAEEITTTRRFKFERSGGAWVINGELFDPCVFNANPALGRPERWILENGSGGWWHPIHMHLEGHQIQTIDGKPPAEYEAAKKDTTILGPNTVAEVFINFRTFPGPFVFHCHNIAHEDMRMMATFDVGGPSTESTDASLVDDFDPDDLD